MMASRLNRSFSAGQTRYLKPYVSVENSDTTESPAQLKIRSTGTVSNLSVVVSVNTSSAGATLTSRKNTAAGGMSISIPAGSTTGEFTDATNSDSLSAGDLYNYQLVVNAGTGAMSLSVINAVFDATTDTCCQLLGFASSTPTSGSTNYCTVNGNLGVRQVEAEGQTKIRTSGTLKNMFVRCTGFGSNTTFTTRINGADGTQTITVTGTGVFEDTSHTDTIASGDLIDYKMVLAAGFSTISIAGCEFVTTNNTFMLVNGEGSNIPPSVATGATSYSACGGRAAGPSATESDSKTTSRLAFTASYLGINALTIPTNPTTVDLRVNGASSALTMSVTGTGITEDTTHSVSIASTDQINYRIAAGSGGSAFTFTSVWMVGAIPSNYVGSVVGFGIGDTNSIIGG